MWAERYDRELKGIFALQDDITRKVMAAMLVTLSEGEGARLYTKRRDLDNMAAYGKRLQALECLRQVTEDSNAKARQLYEEIIAMEPSNAVAHSGLAFALVQAALQGWSKDPQESARKAFELAEKAMALDETLDMPYVVRGSIYLFLRQHESAIDDGRRAVELNPNWAEAHAFLGLFLACADRPQEAIAFIEKAFRLNPMPPGWYYAPLGLSYALTKQYGKSVAAYEKCLQIAPGNSICLRGLTASYSFAGLQEKACKTAAELRRLNPKYSLEKAEKSLPYKNSDYTARAVEALRKAGLK